MEKSVKVVKAKSIKEPAPRGAARAREGDITFLNGRKRREWAALISQQFVHTDVL